MQFLLHLVILILLSIVLVACDVTAPPGVTTHRVRAQVSPEVHLLREEVKKLRKAFNRFKAGGVARGKRKVCEPPSMDMSDKISLELSGLRSQLHTSDSMKSLRSELDYGLTALRSELDNKATSLRAELETGIIGLRAELQSAVSELKTEVTAELSDVRAELQYNLNMVCSGEKEFTLALADMQSGIQTVKSDLDGRLSNARTELEQRMMGVRSDLERGLRDAKSEFKTDVVSARSDLQDMVTTFRTELQDSLAATRSELQTGFMAAQSGLQNSLQSLQATVLDFGSKSQSETATLRAEVSGVSAVMKAEVQTHLTEARSQLHDNLQTLEVDLNKLLREVAGRVQLLANERSQLAYNTSMLAIGLVEVKANAEKSVTSLRNDVATDLKKMQLSLDDAVTLVLAELRHHTAKTLLEANSNATVVDKRLSSIQKDFDLKLTDLRFDLDTKVSDLQHQLKDSGTSFAAQVNKSSAELISLSIKVTQSQELLKIRLQNLQKESAESRGSTFVRWGRESCTKESQLLYRGVVGGSSYDSDGGAANRLCLTLTPQAGNVTGARTYIYGAEYKFAEHHDLDVVCALCFTRYTATLMIPGTQTCPPGWRLQYAGHLTAGMVGHRGASEFLCLDSNPEHRPGSQDNRNGALFYYVFTECGSLPCPPYTDMYVSCVVCSR